MRTIPEGLARHLLSGTTTLCHCWRLETRGGQVLGFTDHDQALTIDGTLYEADAGFAGSEIQSSLGLAVDNLEAAGALSSGRLDEARIRAGDFDDAAVEVWRVNWQDVSQRLLMKRGRLGEVTRGRSFFSAELRGLTEALSQPKGRIFQHGCDAVLGDERCKVRLADTDFSVKAQVFASHAGRLITVSGAQDFAPGFFAGGTCRFTSGANAGRLAEIKFHRVSGGQVTVELWQPAPLDPARGDAFVLAAGCDKQFSTCRSKFRNAANFRGFPHMPGDDFVTGYATHTSSSGTRT